MTTDKSENYSKAQTRDPLWVGARALPELCNARKASDVVNTERSQNPNASADKDSRLEKQF